MGEKKDCVQDRIRDYVDAHRQETLALLKELAVIPAPSGREGRRADFVLRWLHNAGAAKAFMDEAGNVVYPHECRPGEEFSVIMAHMDVVCPDMDRLSLEEGPGRFTGPGVLDDTANLVNMLMAIKFLLACPVPLRSGILFVADVGEEGLGNLKGSRRIYDSYAGRIREWISFDMTYDSMITRAVGSRRYKVSVRTKGGHSYFDFGEKNAVAELSKLIADLYRMEVPDTAAGLPRVTYNVGSIEGGTSVNVIAQQASMLFEIRSESDEELERTAQVFEGILKKHSTDEVRIEAKLLGIRPGNGGTDRQRQAALEQRCLRTVARHCGKTVPCEAGSTDANIPLSAGIPAVTLGTALGGGFHTRGEWVDTQSMQTGQRIALELVLEAALVPVQ